MSSVGTVVSVKVPQSKAQQSPTLPLKRMLKDITTECKRTLISPTHGPTALEHIPKQSFYREPFLDMQALPMPGTYFGIPNHYVGPFITDKGDQAIFKQIKDPFKPVVDGFELEDIHQGCIGDCWFLSAVDFTIHSTHPRYAERMPQIFQVISDDACAANVTLWDPQTATWQTVTVGPHLLLEGSRFPIVISTLSKTPNELWCGMLEKGLAAMCKDTQSGLQGYQAIGGGWMSEGMMLLHGPGKGYLWPRTEIVPMIFKDYESSNSGLTHFAERLNTMIDNGCGIFVYWSKEMAKPLRVASGLVDSHAYSILEVDTQRFRVKLKNPWGRSPFNEREEQEKDITIIEHNTGIFWMDIVDLVAACGGLNIYEPGYFPDGRPL